MNDRHATPCDDELLSRYIDGDLDKVEKKQLAVHLEGCRKCRRQLTVWSNFSQDLRARVHGEADDVDFTSLEKDVLTKALRLHRSNNGGLRIPTALKYGIPAVATACLLLFFGYNHFMAKPEPAPSAIINSFTGSMSSVMIFETPEKRQTILWYNEDTDLESESDAV